MPSRSFQMSMIGLTFFHGLAANSQILCFKSVEQYKGSNIYAEMKLNRNDDTGTVRYKNQKGYVEIGSRHENSLSSRSSMPPAETVSTWTEFDRGVSNGIYQLTTQGAIVHEMKYIRKKDGKSFIFYSDHESYGENGCNWKE